MFPTVNVSSYEAIISQEDYLNYKHAIDDLAVVCKCYEENQLSRLEVIKRRFHQQPEADRVANTIEQTAWLASMQENDQLGLRNRVATINRIHAKLQACQKEPQAGAYLSALDMYNSSLKVVRAWNQMWLSPEFHIQSPYAAGEINDLQPLEIPEKSLSEDEVYVELLREHPELIGSCNNHKEGAYEIETKPEEIAEIRQKTYTRVYEKTRSHALAAAFSQIGEVFKGPYGWTIVRDPVTSPAGHKHTYQRFLQTTPGAVMMPIVVDKDGKEKIVLVLIFRHATRTFEFELPRGGAQPGETLDATAIREALEEAGCVIEKATYLGRVTVDTGVMSASPLIFEGDVIDLVKPRQEKTEAIREIFLFSREELDRAQALTRGDIEYTVEKDGVKYSGYLRDPFLNSALRLKDLSQIN